MDQITILALFLFASTQPSKTFQKAFRTLLLSNELSKMLLNNFVALLSKITPRIEVTLLHQNVRSLELLHHLLLPRNALVANP